MDSTAPLALIVDDDIDWVEILEASISTLGYETCTVSDPPHARAWLAKNKPALIVADLLMPNGDGIGLCQWIRSQPGLNEIPVVIITGLKDEQALTQARSLGGVDFLHKPFKLEALKSATERLVHSTHAAH